MAEAPGEAPKEAPRISDAEWEVMRIVWAEEPVTSREIAEAIDPARGWSEPTIKTLINRLVKKGALTFDHEGKRYLYRAQVSRDHCVRAESRSFVERVFGGTAQPLLAHLLEESDLSAQDIDDLRRLLDEKEAER